MKRNLPALVAFALVACTVGLSNRAHALGPIGIEIGAKGGYGNNPSDGTINPLGVGLGGRAGVTFLGIYGGVNALYYLGGSQSVPNAGNVSQHAFLYGLEAGYGLSLLDLLTIRAQLGVGNATFTTSPDNGQSTSTSKLYLEPGLTGLLTFGMYFIGADVNYLVIPSVDQTGANGQTTSTTYKALTLHGQLGLKF